MFHDRLRRLERAFAAMPASPIYRESESCYIIYVRGSRQVFGSVAEAQPYHKRFETMQEAHNVS